MEEQKQEPNQEGSKDIDSHQGQKPGQPSRQTQYGGEQGRPSRPNPATQESQHENRQQLPKQQAGSPSQDPKGTTQPTSGNQDDQEFEEN